MQPQRTRADPGGRTLTGMPGGPPHPRRGRSRAAPALPRARAAVPALLAALTLGACGSASRTPSPPAGPKSSPAPTSPTAPTAPPAAHARTGNGGLISIFGGAAQLTNDPAGTLDQLKKLGVQRIRVDVRWSQFAPAASARQPPAGFRAADPAGYPAAAWAPLDAVVQAAAARGIGVEATLGGPAPLWAEGPGDPVQAGEPVGIWKPRAADFAQFVQAVGTRYSGDFAGAGGRLPRISFWSIWNEPNYGQDLAPQAIDHSAVEVAPALYRGLVGAAWTGLHTTGHGRDTILIGETAPRGITTGDNPGNFSGMVPLRFLRALYCLDAGFAMLRGTAATLRGCPASGAAAGFRAANPGLFQATGLAAHLYPQGELSPATRVPGEPDFADFASLPVLASTLDRALGAYGSSRRLPIYSTEFGYQTNPPELYHAPPALASAYLNEAEYLSWRNPRIRSYDQYLLSDPPNAGPSSGFDTGLEFKDGTPKATLAAFRMPLYLPVTSERGGGPLEVWGEVRPAPYAAAQTGAVQHAEIQFAAGTGGAFRTLRSIPLPATSGYFDTTVRFPGPGTVRLAWSYPGGAQALSRTVAVTK